MGWLNLFRFLAVFVVFYVGLPLLLQGRRQGVHWTLRVAEVFAVLAFFLQFAIMGLSLLRMALPGAVLVLYALWLFYHYVRHKPELFRWQALRCLPADLRAGAWLCLPGLWLLLIAQFPVHNLRFTQLDGYSRALSLAVLSNGQPWRIDASVPVLEPLLFLSALPAPAVIGCAGVLFGLLFVIAAAFAAYSYTRNEHAAFFAAGFSILASVWRGALDGSTLGRPEMLATFALLALGLAPHAPVAAILAGITCASMITAGNGATGVIAGILCAALGALAAWAARPLLLRKQSAVMAGGTLLFIVAISLHPSREPADGPFQYEAAARACDRFARTQPRNAWLVVSPSQELAFTYGCGWHVELADVVSKFTYWQVVHPDFRFPYPVRDVFFFIERQPLRPARERVAVNVTYSADPVVLSYFTALGRTTLEFRAAELLAAYGKSHPDLQTVYADDHLVVYRTAGTLPTSSIPVPPSTPGKLFLRNSF
jgi:hypothetical protein